MGAPVEVVRAQVVSVVVAVAVVVVVAVVVAEVERKEWSGDVTAAVSCRSRLSEPRCLQARFGSPGSIRLAGIRWRHADRAVQAKRHQSVQP